MTGTPIYDQLVAERDFKKPREGVRHYSAEGDGPPEGEAMQLENAYGDRIEWNGKRWRDPNGEWDSWPSDLEGVWREVKES